LKDQVDIQNTIFVSSALRHCRSHPQTFLEYYFRLLSLATLPLAFPNVDSP
jgi:hypothetical protein